MAKIFGKMALPGVQLLNKSKFLTKPSLMCTTAHLRTPTSLAPPTGPTLTVPKVIWEGIPRRLLTPVADVPAIGDGCCGTDSY